MNTSSDPVRADNARRMREWMERRRIDPMYQISPALAEQMEVVKRLVMDTETREARRSRCAFFAGTACGVLLSIAVAGLTLCLS